MEHLFGSLCSGLTFLHDNMMREEIGQTDSRPRKRARRDSDSSAILSTQHSSLEIPEDLANSISSNSLPMQALQNPADEEAETRSGSQNKNASKAKETTASQQSLRTDVLITDSQLSLPVSGTSLPSPPETKIRAIRRALEKKAQNDEIEFYLPSSISTSSQRLVPSTTANESSQHQLREAAAPPSSSPSPDAPSAAAEPHGAQDDGDSSDSGSTISLSPSAFDSQRTAAVTNDNDDPSQNSLQSDSNVRSPAANKRTRRMDAYCAVRDGTSDLWFSVYSPITGDNNNHSSEDVEL